MKHDLKKKKNINIFLHVCLLDVSLSVQNFDEAVPFSFLSAGGRIRIWLTEESVCARRRLNVYATENNTNPDSFHVTN